MNSSLSLTGRKSTTTAVAKSRSLGSNSAIGSPNSLTQPQQHQPSLRPSNRRRQPIKSSTTYIIILLLISIVGIQIYLMAIHVNQPTTATVTSSKMSELAKLRKANRGTTRGSTSSRHSSKQRRPLPRQRNSKQGGAIGGRINNNLVDDHPGTDPNNSALCLLTKDDVDILPEWIAYHYHTLRLRHLIVAVDPSSEEFPSQLLLKFKTLLPDLYIEEWHDENYLPEYFTKDKNYSMVPNFMGRSIQHMTFGEWTIKEKVRPIIVRDMTIINKHRFRQVKFVTKCLHRLLSIRNQQQGSSYADSNDEQEHPPITRFVSPLDSDEYIVINPRILSKIFPNNTTATTASAILNGEQTQKEETWKTVESGSVIDFLANRIDTNGDEGADNDYSKFHEYIYYKQPPAGQQQMQPVRLKSDDKTEGSSEQVYEGDGSCIPVPRLLFGSVEDSFNNSTRSIRSTSSTPGRFNVSKFETLRWKYHAPYLNEYNYIQKVVIDLSKLPKASSTRQQNGDGGEYDLDTLLSWLGNPGGVGYSSTPYKDFAYSVHQPSWIHCPPETTDGLDHPLFGSITPLSINHYLGSWERYDTRDDKRRSERVSFVSQLDNDMASPALDILFVL